MTLWTSLWTRLWTQFARGACGSSAWRTAIMTLFPPSARMLDELQVIRAVEVLSLHHEDHALGVDLECSAALLSNPIHRKLGRAVSLPVAEALDDCEMRSDPGKSEQPHRLPRCRRQGFACTRGPRARASGRTRTEVVPPGVPIG